MKYRSRTRRPEVDPVHLALLRDEPVPDGGNRFAVHSFARVAPALWRAHRDAILADWIDDKPGTRPSCWWMLDAPNPPPPWRTWSIRNHPIPAAEQRAFLQRHGLLLPCEADRR